MKPKAKKQRPFNSNVLETLALPILQPHLGGGAVAWRYTILVPVEEVKASGETRPAATEDDLFNIEMMLNEHFGGVTTSTTIPSLMGWGARDPRRPTETKEGNKHAFFQVYAAALRASDDYFLALQTELQDALREGIILIERQDVTIL